MSRGDSHPQSARQNHLAPSKCQERLWPPGAWGLSLQKPV